MLVSAVWCMWDVMSLVPLSKAQHDFNRKYLQAKAVLKEKVFSSQAFSYTRTVAQ